MDVNIDHFHKRISDLFSPFVESGVKLAWLDETDLCLITKDSIVWMPMVRGEGLDVYYVRKRTDKFFDAYRISVMLGLRSRGTVVSRLPAPTDWSEEVLVAADWAVQALSSFGHDILAGDERWIGEAGIDPIRFPPPLVRKLKPLAP